MLTHMKHVRLTDNDNRALASLATTVGGETLLQLLEKEWAGELQHAMASVRRSGEVDCAAVHRAAALDEVLKLVREAHQRVNSPR